MFVGSYLGDATPAQLAAESAAYRQMVGWQQAYQAARDRGDPPATVAQLLTAYQKAQATYRSARAVSAAADRQMSYAEGVGARVGDLQTAGVSLLKGVGTVAGRVVDQTLKTTNDLGTGLKWSLPVIGAAAVGVLALMYLPKRSAVRANPRRRRKRR